VGPLLAFCRCGLGIFAAAALFDSASYRVTD
jgi:hypothetical protein